MVPSVSKIPEARILIIHDKDDKECKEVKQQLVDIVGNKSSYPILFRIICHELECWFLGDMDAIEKAFPRFKAKHYKNKNLYRNVDNITNAPQILRQIIPEYKNTIFLPKIETSRKIAPYLNIDRNSSQSFKHFILGVKKLIAD